MVRAEAVQHEEPAAELGPRPRCPRPLPPLPLAPEPLPAEAGGSPSRRRPGPQGWETGPKATLQPPAWRQAEGGAGRLRPVQGPFGTSG